MIPFYEGDYYMQGFFRMLSKKGVESIALCLLIFTVISYMAQESFLPEAMVPVSASASPVVILDAGHGGTDGGTQGVSGTLEKDLNLRYALGLGELLSLFGYRVIQSRTEDSLVLKEGEDIYGMRKRCDLKNRKDLMRQYTDAVFLSIHMNAFPVAKYKGLQVYYAQNQESRRLAEGIQGIVKAHLQQDNGRLPKAADESLYLLDGVKTPAVLVECGFLSNEEDEKNLLDESYQKRLCFLLLCAIMK